MTRKFLAEPRRGPSNPTLFHTRPDCADAEGMVVLEVDDDHLAKVAAWERTHGSQKGNDAFALTACPTCTSP